MWKIIIPKPIKQTPTNQTKKRIKKKGSSPLCNVCAFVCVFWSFLVIFPSWGQKTAEAPPKQPGIQKSQTQPFIWQLPQVSPMQRCTVTALLLQKGICREGLRWETWDALLQPTHWEKGGLGCGNWFLYIKKSRAEKLVSNSQAVSYLPPNTQINKPF